ncbi:MAG: phytoene/squalene synthase family protein [Rhizobiaceae bacterium]
MKISDLKYCYNLVSQNARDLYLADLLLPKEMRDDIIVLHAFHVEITNITLASREPMAGEVRLQWWADVVAGKRHEEAEGHPLARALLRLIVKHNLPRSALDAKLEAHIFDLYQDPMGDRTMLEGYFGETRSVLFQMAALIIGISPSPDLANASGHAGVATGVVGMLEQMAMHRSSGKIFIPSDLLLAAGISVSEFMAMPASNHNLVVHGVIDLAEEHYQMALKALLELPQSARLVFKSLAIVPHYLHRAKASPSLVLSGLPASSQFKRQWALWRF